MAGKSVERFVRTNKAYTPSLGPDNSLAFLMDIDDVLQVWRIDEPDSWPEQLTLGDDGVAFAQWSPTRPELIYGRDADGDGRTQLYRIDADGDRVTPLTDEPSAIHRWGGWSNDGSQFAFAANRRDSGSFDVYVQRRDAEQAERVYESDAWLNVAGWGPNDDRLALTVSHGSHSQDVYVLHVESGQLEQVTPDDEDVRFQSINFGQDGESLYLITDWGSDTLYFGRLDLSTRRISRVVHDEKWNIEGVNVDPETGRFAFGKNVDGYTEVTTGRVSGTTVERFPEPALPDGVAGETTFGPDAERFAITVTTPVETPNVYVVNVRTGETTRWTNASPVGISVETFVSPQVVRYSSFDGREIPAFFFMPDEPTEGKTPLLVRIHGGPEKQHRPSFSPVTQYFLSEGYAVLEPNIRGSTGYGKQFAALDDGRRRPDAFADVRAAVEWALHNDAIDPDGVVAMGSSYGGFVVLAALAEYPDLWAAGVEIAGFPDLVSFLENTPEWRRSLREAEYGSLTEDRAFLERISPLNQLESITAPLFVIHGENDSRVPISEAEKLVEQMRERGLTVEQLFFSDEGHGISRTENEIEVYERIAHFIRSNIY